jgi:hypothetical protein
MKTSSDRFTLHFGTKPHQLDAKTLAATLSAIEEVVREVNRLNEGATEISVMVHPFEKGSFEVPVAIQQIVGVGALTLASVDWRTAPDVIKVLVDLLKLSIDARTKKKREIGAGDNTITINGNRGKVTIVDKRVFQIFEGNVKVCDSLAKGFAALEDDTEVKRLKVLDSKRRTLINIPRKKFPAVSNRKIEETENERTVRERIELTVSKIVFDAAPNWRFFYRGFPIPATICDPEFISKVKEGEPFARGDVLDVDLEITQKFDPAVQTYVNKLHRITKVYRHTHRARQTDLSLL